LGNGAALLYQRRQDYVEPIAEKAPPLYTLLYNKWFVDEGYDYVFTGRRKIGDIRLGAMGAGEASSWFDAKIIDGAVNDAGWVTRAVATLSTWWDKWIIDGMGVNGPAILARMISYPARLFEWGLVQWYALVMVAGLLGFGIVLRVESLKGELLAIGASAGMVTSQKPRANSQELLCRVTYCRSFSSRR
jgi:NADH:ubiquinone oxidoreductase subunit 5 (subunit L)/multisubunit Na+/H+ antiporter MnhA subunit